MILIMMVTTITILMLMMVRVMKGMVMRRMLVWMV